MRKNYFIDRKGIKNGPYTIQELNNIKIFENDLIWNNELDNWTEAKNLVELSNLIIVNPPKTKKEIIEEKTGKFNKTLQKKVLEYALKAFLIFTVITTVIAFNNTQKFMNESIQARKDYYYYFSDSILTRSIKAVFNNCTIESGEYDSELLLFFNLIMSSIFLYGLIILPLGFFYYFHEESKYKRNLNQTGYYSKDDKNDSLGEITYNDKINLKEEINPVCNEDFKWGYCDTSGKILIPHKFNASYKFINDYAIVILDEKYGMIDKLGNFLISPEYEFLEPFADGLAVARLNRKFGFIDKNNKVVYDFIYDDAESFFNGKAKVKLENKISFLVPALQSL